MIEKSENENLKIYLPKTNKSVYAFIQYFNEKIYVYKNEERKDPQNLNDNYNFNYYAFDEGIELYADANSTKAYKSFFYVSYLDVDYYEDIHEY